MALIMRPCSLQPSAHTSVFTDMLEDQVLYPEMDELFEKYFQLYHQRYLTKQQIPMDDIQSSPSSQSSFQASPTTSGVSSPTWADNQTMNINCQIKAELTSLINCSSVKKDGQLRAWVQDRLMEVEQDCRKQRRRKSNASKNEQGF